MVSLCSCMHRYNIKLSHSTQVDENLPRSGRLGAAPDTVLCPATVSLTKGSQEAPGLAQAALGWCSRCVSPDQSPGSPGRGVAASSFDHASFLFPAEIGPCVPKAEPRGSRRGSRHSPRRFPTPPSACSILSQPSETLTQDLETSWSGGGPEKNQDMQRRQEQLLWGSVGERLNTTHTHTSPLTEHPAPPHTLLLSPELRLGHTGSPTPQGAVPLLCSPRPWAALGPHELGVLQTQPSGLPRGQLGGTSCFPDTACEA